MVQLSKKIKIKKRSVYPPITEKKLKLKHFSTSYTRKATENEILIIPSSKHFTKKSQQHYKHFTVTYLNGSGLGSEK